MKRCTKCNSLMPVDAAKCIKCGFEAGKKTAPVSATRAAPPPVEPINWSTASGEKPGRIYGGWLLARQSWKVLMLDKELLMFPLVSGIACFLVLASFLGAAFAIGVTRSGSAAPSEATQWALVFAYYFLNYFVIVFFNSALVACAMIRFQGGDPTVADGMRAAGARLPQIVAWALLAATVGVVLRIIQERVEFVGKIVIGLLGAAWAIAVYFIVPVLVVEKLGPFDAVARSVTLMKQTWGESLVSNVGIGLVVMVATIVILLVGGAATIVIFALSGSTAVLVIGGILIVAFLVTASLIGSALNSIVLTALYLYAAEKKVPKAFDGVAQFAFASK
jgi:hypothetical protein